MLLRHPMDHIEAQSRAIIASALIVSGAIAVPSAGATLSHSEGLRLRELTDHVYRLLTRERLSGTA
jgi:hypothetical protein